MTRFTYREMEAIETALNQCLSGPLDGYDEGTPEARDKERAMRAALVNPHAARSRWFSAPLADVTPRERALLDELAGAVAWAEGLAGAIAELDAEHYPDPDLEGRGGCVMCWPADGAWPCTTRQIADALREPPLAEELHAATLTPREQRIYAAGFKFGRKAAAEGARLAAERGLAGEGA